MKNRPWPLVILAVLHVLAPIANVFWNAHLLNLRPEDFVFHLWHNHSVLDNATFYLLLPIAAVAIYAVKEWSYPVFFVAIAWTTYNNFLTGQTSPRFSSAVVLAACVFNIAIVSYFLFPQVRAAYFNRFLRWWEISPRFSINTTGVLIDSAGRSISCHIKNLSIGGALITTSQPVDSMLASTLRFTTININYDVAIRIARITPEGLGLSFTHSNATLKAFRKLIKAMTDAGVPCPARVRSNDERFSGWIKRFLKTGKGLLPEQSESNKSTIKKAS